MTYCNLNGIRLIIRLRLDLSHLREDIFKNNFRNSLNSLCNCGSSIELTPHFLLYCPIFNDKRHILLSTLNNSNCKILESTDYYLTKALLYRSTSFGTEMNTLVLNATIDYILYFQDLQNLFFRKKTLIFICNYLILSEFSLVYYNYLLSYYHFNILFSIFFLFCTNRHSRFSGRCSWCSVQSQVFQQDIVVITWHMKYRSFFLLKTFILTHYMDIKPWSLVQSIKNNFLFSW